MLCKQFTKVAFSVQEKEFILFLKGAKNMKALLRRMT